MRISHPILLVTLALALVGSGCGFIPDPTDTEGELILLELVQSSADATTCPLIDPDDVDKAFRQHFPATSEVTFIGIEAGTREIEGWSGYACKFNLEDADVDGDSVFVSVGVTGLPAAEYLAPSGAEALEDRPGIDTDRGRLVFATGSLLLYTDRDVSLSVGLRPSLLDVMGPDSKVALHESIFASVNGKVPGLVE